MGLVSAVVGIRLAGPAQENPLVLAGPPPATAGPNGEVPFCRRGDVQGTLELTGSGTTAQGRLILTAPAQACVLLEGGQFILELDSLSSVSESAGTRIVLRPGEQVTAGVGLSGRLCGTGGLGSAILGRSPDGTDWSPEADGVEVALRGGPSVPRPVLGGTDTWTLIGCGPRDSFGAQACRFDTVDGRLVEMTVTDDVSGVRFLE